MILITGGAYAGKTDYVKKRYGCEIINGEQCSFGNVFTAECVSNFHILVKRLIENKIDVISFTEQLCRDNKKLIVITNEIGCGIIPHEKSDRFWREQAGRAGCIVAENSEIAVRLCCGIATVIKGEDK